MRVLILFVSFCSIALGVDGSQKGWLMFNKISVGSIFMDDGSGCDAKMASNKNSKFCDSYLQIDADGDLFYTSEKHKNTKGFDIDHDFVLNGEKPISKDSKITFKLLRDGYPSYKDNLLVDQTMTAEELLKAAKNQADGYKMGTKNHFVIKGLQWKNADGTIEKP